jgi:poly(3-hydroxybutyrate) depolymerase
VKCKLILIAAFGLGAMQVFAQLPSANGPFPLYHPVLGEPDTPGNAYPYYAYTGTYPACTVLPDAEVSCERTSFQYVYEEGRFSGDGRSDCDVYYTDTPNPGEGEGKPLVLLLHGGSGSRKSSGLVKRAMDLSRRGYVVAVPDYITARDAFYGSNVNATQAPCFTQEQKWLMLQQSVRDVYSVVRSVLRLTQIGENPWGPIDVDAIFMFGISHGAYTALHLAAMDGNDFPSGEVSFANGNSFNFQTDLAGQAICDGPGGCLDFVPYEGYNLRNSLKAIACSAPFTLDPALFEAATMPSVLLFHGTCDASAPYWFVNQADAVIRATWAVVPGFNPLLMPCQLPDDPYDELFGSQVIHSQLESSDPLQNHFRGFITFCSGRHDIASVYGIDGQDPNDLSLGLIDYELLRFFAHEANNSYQQNFSFVLDDALRVTSDADLQTTIDHCNAVQSVGPAWEGLGDICPGCDTAATAYFEQVRLPYFVAGSDDHNRYPALLAYQNELEGCDIVNNITDQTGRADIQGDGILDVFTWTGQSIMRHEWKELTLSALLLERKALPPGLYAVHFRDGKKQALVVR